MTNPVHSHGVHGTPRRATVLWGLLSAATVLTWILSLLKLPAAVVLAALVVISVWKINVVARDFMALHASPRLWRWLLPAWAVLVWAIILIAYWKGAGTP